MSNNLLRGLVAAGALASASAALTATAQDELSKGDKEWMEKEVGAIITREEIDIFSSIDKDDRKLFKELFWLRRDYTEGTSENEYRDGFEQRVDVANDSFKVRGRKGSESDMGRIFVLMGAPSEQQRGGVAGEGGLPEIPAAPENDRANEGPSPTRVPGSASGGGEETMLWVYNPNEPLGIPDGLAVEFRQRDQFGFRIANGDDIAPHLERVKERMIANRRIAYARDDNGRLKKADDQVDPNSPAKQLLAEMRATGATSSAIAFSVTPSYFRASGDEIYVAVDFTVTEGATSGELTFFHAIVGDDGFETIVERPELLTKDASGAWRYEYPFQLDPGLYTLYVGFLDSAAQTHGTQIVELDVPTFTGDALTLSSIVMYATAEPTDQIHGTPGTAFLLAGHHFKPKNGSVYDKSEYVSGVFNAYNYGLAGDTPNLTIQVSFFKDGEPRGQTQESPFAAQVAQLALATFDIPLNIPNFSEPGEYTFEITVTDHVKNETLKKEFDIVVEEE